MPTVFGFFHDVFTGEEAGSAGLAFELSQGVAGVRKGFFDEESGAFAFGALVPHDFFEEAEVGNLVFVQFPNRPLV